MNNNFILKDSDKLEFSMDAKGSIKVYPPLSDIEITPTKENQIFKNQEEYGYDYVTVKPIPENYIDPKGAITIDKNGVTNVREYQNVIVDISIPENYIDPKGTKTITENGVTNIREYENVDVNVEVLPRLQEKEVTPTKEDQHIKADPGYDGLLKVQVNAIPNEYIIPKLQDLEVECIENGEHTIVADSGYDGINSVHITTNVKGGGGDGDGEEPNYIQNGLVAWWDGADEPDENGHWVSRVGDDYISQYTTALGNSSVLNFSSLHSKKDKCYRNNCMYGLTTQNDYWVKNYTFEVVCKVTSTANSSSITSTSAGSTILSFNRAATPMISVADADGWFKPYLSSSITIPKKYTNLYHTKNTMVLSLTNIPARNSSGNCSVSYSLNGQGWYTTGTTSCPSVSSKANNVTIMCGYQDSKFACCEVNSIRIYSRKLSASELAHNYAEDQKRFDMGEDI